MPGIKALHVIAVIAWMAGMLYLLRLYAYHAQETEAIVMERLRDWERKLLDRITTPAAVVAVLSGGSMLALEPWLLRLPWMHVKLLAIAGMLITHGFAIRWRLRLISEPHFRTTRFFRIMNEVPTLLMMVIVTMGVVMMTVVVGRSRHRLSPSRADARRQR